VDECIREIRGFEGADGGVAEGDASTEAKDDEK
jgi:hypothetical protein